MLENPYLRKVNRTFQDFEVIFEEGSYGDELCIVSSGGGELRQASPGAADCDHDHSTGAIFGGNGFGGQRPRSVSAVAGTDQPRLLALDLDKFLFLVRYLPASALTGR
jgi:CRP-like cAMP-binding protein